MTDDILNEKNKYYAMIVIIAAVIAALAFLIFRYYRGIRQPKKHPLTYEEIIQSLTAKKEVPPIIGKKVLESISTKRTVPAPSKALESLTAPIK